MKRCPVCNSRRWRENKIEKGKWKCFKCGKEWLDPRYHTTIFPKNNGGGALNGNAIALNSNQTAIIDYHNIVYKFFIIKDNPNIHLQYQKQMRGWIQEWEEKDFVKFQRTPHSIIIFLNKRVFRDDIGVVEFEVLELVKIHAQRFSERYNIILDLNHPEAVRKEVKLLEGFHSAEQFQGKLVKCVYPDGRIEFIDKEKAISHTENFITGLAIENKAEVILDAMVKWNRNFELHYSVLNDMKDTLKNIQDNVQKPQGFSVKIIKFFGLWSAKAKLKTISLIKKLGGEKNEK